MRYNNRMQGIFDKMYKPNEDYEERLTEGLRQVARGTQIAARLIILGSILFIGACSLVISACIKYLFFS